MYPSIVANRPQNRPVPSVLDQCVAEQRYVRQSMVRTLMYAQVRRQTRGGPGLSGSEALALLLSSTPPAVPDARDMQAGVREAN